MKYTPKPWQIEKGQLSASWFIHHRGTEVCMVPSNTMYQEANAHLIAAAPDLLEACEDAVKRLEARSNGNGDEKTAVHRLKGAIKKATTELLYSRETIKSPIKTQQWQKPLTIFQKQPASTKEISGEDKSIKHNDTKFGTMAIAKGFITKEQLIEAIKKQIEEDLEEGKHRRIGAILQGFGYLPEERAREVLESMNQR